MIGTGIRRDGTKRIRSNGAENLDRDRRNGRRSRDGTIIEKRVPDPVGKPQAERRRAHEWNAARGLGSERAAPHKLKLGTRRCLAQYSNFKGQRARSLSTVDLVRPSPRVA